MAAPVNTGMPKADMKRLLVRSKSEPVSCAIGLGDNNALGLLMMHRTKNGKACEKMLQEEFPNAKNLRWGKAFVDVDDNPKLVKLTLNRAVMGMAKRLTKTLKGTGFTKVMIVLEDGSAVEAHEEEDETLAEEAVGQAAAAPAPAEEEGEPVAAAPPPPPPPPQAAGPDKAAQTAQLQKLLAALAPRIPAAAGSDPARKALLMKMATDANVNLKTGNLGYAATALSQLKIALDAPAPAAGEDLGAVAAKTRIEWAGLQTTIKGDVERLGAALEAAYAGEPFAKDVTSRFDSTVGPVLARFDNSLDSVLGRFAGAAPEAQGPLISEARVLIESYLTFAASTPLLQDLDENPFVPLKIRAGVNASLEALRQALH